MTGYTQIVAENDNVAFKDFALRCARSFGALIEMRDEPLDAPIPERFEPSDFYKKKYEKMKDAYDNFVANLPSKEEMDKKYAEYVAIRTKEAEEYNKKREIRRKRYEAMLEKVKKWVPPTSGHENLKKFMIQQLEESLEWDCLIYKADILNKDEWIESFCSVDAVKRRMDSYFEYWQKEVARTEERNCWLKDLRVSLEGID